MTRQIGTLCSTYLDSMEWIVRYHLVQYNQYLDSMEWIVRYHLVQYVQYLDSMEWVVRHHDRADGDLVLEEQVPHLHHTVHPDGEEH